MISRLLDIFFSVLALIILLPLLISVSIILRFTGEGEVIFSQKRVGRNGKPFNLFKFATMLKGSPSMGSGTVTIRNDPRVLPFGKILRKTKINELPQLINVLNGSMSIVGPRPQTPRCFKVFPIDLQPLIYSVRPGLSGLGPVIFRDEESILFAENESVDFYDEVIAPYKGEVEAHYTCKNNVVSYFKIIFLTLWVLIFPKSSLAWKVFPSLPIPPDKLKSPLNFPGY